MTPSPRLHDPHPQSGDWPSERARLLEGIPRDPDPLPSFGQQWAATGFLDMSGPDLYEPERHRHPKRDRRALVLAAIAAAGMVFLAGIWAGRATATSRPSSGAAEWRTVTIQGEAPSRDDEGTGPSLWTGLGVDGASSTPIYDPQPSREAPQPPGAVAPEAQVTVRSVGTASTGSGVSGLASFYDDPRKSGIYAAAGPAIRVGDWRGRTVTVCGAVCFAVVLGDFCGCPGGRVIDLSSTAFARLASLSAGLTTVVVSW